ncbi:HPP family protein [Oceanimonas sp. NS1]|nr:HPP family protein [Oceanimonas sp. NS1]
MVILFGLPDSPLAQPRNIFSAICSPPWWD